jgi:hypothetical protein
MSLKVVFQICFGSIKMMGMWGVLVPRSGQLSYSIYVSKRPAEPLVYLGHPVVSLFIWVNQLSAYLSGSNNCQLIYLGQPIVSLFILANQLSSQTKKEIFSGVCVARSLVFCVMFCRSLFVLFVLAIVLCVLRVTTSNYPFGIFKL